MHHVRFTIRSLMVAVLVVAILFSGPLRYPLFQVLCVLLACCPAAWWAGRRVQRWWKELNYLEPF